MHLYYVVCACIYIDIYDCVCMCLCSCVFRYICVCLCMCVCSCVVCSMEMVRIWFSIPQATSEQHSMQTKQL